MQKTRLGISVGLLGATIYLMGLYGGYLITALLVGYVLMFEENEWLKKNAVKAFALMICFSLLSTLIYLVPNVIGVISSIFEIFGGMFYLNFISSFANAISGVLNILEMVLFIGLGLKALTQGNITIPVVDELIDTYMG